MICSDVNMRPRKARRDGIDNAPIPKNSPSKLRLLPLPFVLISATAALVAPFIAPPPTPNRKIEIFKRNNEPEKAIPRKPAAIKRQQLNNKYLYPYLSQSGPKASDPVSKPKGRIENKVPV